jgi:hypothetical protein
VKNPGGTGFRIGYWLSIAVASILFVIFVDVWSTLVMLAFLIPVGLFFEALLYGQRKHQWWSPEPIEEDYIYIPHCETIEEEDDLE